MNCIIFILPKFRTELLAANCLIIRKRTKFGTKEKYWKFLLKIMILVSSADNTGSDAEFILRGRSIIHIMANSGPGIDPWGTPCFNVTQSEKKF